MRHNNCNQSRFPEFTRYSHRPAREFCTVWDLGRIERLKNTNSKT